MKADSPRPLPGPTETLFHARKSIRGIPEYGYELEKHFLLLYDVVLGLIRMQPSG